MVMNAVRLVFVGDNMFPIAGRTCAALGTTPGLSTGAIMCSPADVETWGQRALASLRADIGGEAVHPQFTGLITGIIDLSPIRPGQCAGSHTRQDTREISL